MRKATTTRGQTCAQSLIDIGTATPTEKAVMKPSELQQQLEALNESICSLQAVANRLVDGLAPVMKPPRTDPQAIASAAPAPEALLSPVGDSIRAFAHRVDAIKFLLEEEPEPGHQLTQHRQLLSTRTKGKR